MKKNPELLMLITFFAIGGIVGYALYKIKSERNRLTIEEEQGNPGMVITYGKN